MSIAADFSCDAANAECPRSTAAGFGSLAGSTGIGSRVTSSGWMDGKRLGRVGRFQRMPSILSSLSMLFSVLNMSTERRSGCSVLRSGCVLSFIMDIFSTDCRWSK